MQRPTESAYDEPRADIIYVEVEAGFNASSGDDSWGLPGENPDNNDFGEF